MTKSVKQKNIKKTSSAKPWRSRGFTLVETLIAISIFSFSILALMLVLGQGISDTGYAKKKIIAGYLAQEGIEYIRNMRDTAVLYSANGWVSDFKSKLNSCNEAKGCGFDNSTLPFVCNVPSDCKLYINNDGYNTDSSGPDSSFTRKIWMDTAGLGQDEVKISSEVKWTQGSGTYSITFAENLFNWVE